MYTGAARYRTPTDSFALLSDPTVRYPCRTPAKADLKWSLCQALGEGKRLAAQQYVGEVQVIEVAIRRLGD
jgi:hypothetical protein